MKFAAGTVVDHYRIICKRGSGGMADVYEAEESDPERRVALKVLPKYRAESEEMVQRFRREARSAAALNHRGIVHIYKVGFDAALDVHYISMRLLTGGDLCSRINAGMSALDALMILRELADAFRHAHARGVIHRDVKPSNVLFDDQDCPVLTDFGIAKALDSVSLTKTGTAMGTPTYMSPEQGSGQPSDARSDLYSLGVMLFEMICGHPPYVGDNPFAVMHLHMTAPIPPLPESFRRLQPLVQALMAKSPDERPKDATDLLSRIDALMGLTGPITPLRIAARPVDPQLLSDLQQRTSGKRPIVVQDSSETPTEILPSVANPGSGRDSGAQARASGQSATRSPTHETSAATAILRRPGSLSPRWVVGVVIAAVLAAGAGSSVYFWREAETKRIEIERKEREVREAAQQEQEAMKRAEKEIAERIARELEAKAQLDAKEKAQLEAQTRAVREEARRRRELEARDKAQADDAEAKAKVEQRLRELDAREATLQDAELEAKKRAEVEAKAKTEQQAREQAERESRAKEQAERDARKKQETEDAARREAEAAAQKKKTAIGDAEDVMAPP